MDKVTERAGSAPPISFTTVHLRFRATRQASWPHFAGGKLRGAFGRALRQAACVTGKQSCEGCSLRVSCAYGVVFDPAPARDPLHPSFRDGIPLYVIRPGAFGAVTLVVGQEMNVELILLPGAHEYQRLLTNVLKTAIERELEIKRSFELIAIKLVEVNTEALSRLADTNNLAGIANTAFIGEPSAIEVRLLSPLRIQKDGMPIMHREQMTPDVLVRALFRRFLQWCQIKRIHPPNGEVFRLAASYCQLDTTNLHWHDMARFSSTQGKKVPLGGLVGSFVMSGPQPAIEIVGLLLQSAELLHFGKETVMGLGQIACRVG